MDWTVTQRLLDRGGRDTAFHSVYADRPYALWIGENSERKAVSAATAVQRLPRAACPGPPHGDDVGGE
jgi:hypothetical protein